MPVVAFRPLRHRRFAILWTAGLISNIGTWLQNVAVGALVQGITRSALWTAVTFIASFLPNGVLAPIGGALADRLDRRTSTIILVSGEAAVAAGLALVVAAGNTAPVVVTALVFLGGCIGAFRMPFQQAMLPDLVPPEDIVGAASLGSAQWNLGRVVGPALAGLVIFVGSFSLAFALNAASFLAVVVAFVFVQVPRLVHTSPAGTLFAQLRGGLGTVRRTPALRSAITLIALASATVAPFIALVPAVADGLVEGGTTKLAGTTGALVTAQGVGAVLAALLFPSLVERFGRRRMLVVAFVLTPCVLVPYALAPTVATAAAAIFFVGAAYICILSGLSAVMQLHAPAAFRGRVLSLYFGTLSLVFPIGALAQGALANRLGLATTTIGGAALMLLALAVIALKRPELLRALDTKVASPQPPVITDATQAASVDDATERAAS